MTQLGPILTNAISYWEKRRIPYNLVLMAVVIYDYLHIEPGFLFHLKSWENFLTLVVLAALANVCYCMAYLVDVPVQLSEFRNSWLPRRGLLWGLGTVLAAILTHLACVTGAAFPFAVF